MHSSLSVAKTRRRPRVYAGSFILPFVPSFKSLRALPLDVVCKKNRVCECEVVWKDHQRRDEYMWVIISRGSDRGVEMFAGVNSACLVVMSEDNVFIFGDVALLRRPP